MGNSSLSRCHGNKDASKNRLTLQKLLQFRFRSLKKLPFDMRSLKGEHVRSAIVEK